MDEYPREQVEICIDYKGHGGREKRLRSVDSGYTHFPWRSEKCSAIRTKKREKGQVRCEGQKCRRVARRQLQWGDKVGECKC